MEDPTTEQVKLFLEAKCQWRAFAIAIADKIPWKTILGIGGTAVTLPNIAVIFKILVKLF